ncbi:ABC transporter substrate-binding protein [Microbacterium aurantiacum]|uniref:ABC transporter substrate-binding protein n=1 Tax=Microbacterium aurantiacum TaxID=162393 RepID=UPI001FEC6AA6|nr:ABC transporter substrate-binding protein [Microbacterium aurantiacum]
MSHRRHTLMTAAALTAAVALTTTSCAAGGGAESVATDTIRTTIDVPATFDPSLTLSLPDNLLARTSYDTLVRRDESGLVPGLASEWTATPTQAVLIIREGATCADGTAITPTVVKDSLEYFARPDSPSTTAGQVFGGTPPTIAADDSAGTVTIDLGAPWPDLMTGLSISSTGIVCPAGLADPEGLAAGTVKGSESGPYTLESFEPGVKYRFTLREDYDAWPEWTTTVNGTPAKTLEYVVSPDSTATANLVISGQLDIGKIQAQTIERFDAMDGYEVAINRFSDFYLMFNERPSSLFADPALRLGVAQAIDRAMFEEVSSLGTGEIATSLASNLTPCVAEATTAVPDQDVEAATAALSGLSIRFIGPTIAGPAGAGNEYIAEALRAAGAEVTIENTDVGTWIATVFGEPDGWDLTMFADLNFLGSLTSPLGSFVGPSIGDGGGNIGAASNTAAEEAYAAALTAASEEERCASLNSAVNALVENVDVLPLINDAFIYVQRPGFTVQMLGGSLDDPIFRIAD